MRVVALTMDDPRRRHGGSQVRDHTLVWQALRGAHDVTAFGFGPPAESAPDVADLHLAPHRRTVHRVRALAQGRMFLSGKVPIESQEPALGTALSTADMLYTSQLYLSEQIAPRSGNVPWIWDTQVFDPLIWAQRADAAGIPLSLLHRHQAARASRLLRRHAPRADLVLAVSGDDADSIRQLVPTARVAVLENAVDFDGHQGVEDLEAARDGRTLAVIGSFAQHDTYTGTAEFLASTWPELRLRRPDVRLRLIGRSPRGPLLDGHPGVERRHDVSSIADELVGCDAILLPLRAGGGSKLKAIEAIGAGLPVIATPESTVGIPDVPDHVVVADHESLLGVLSTGDLPDVDRAAIGAIRRRHGVAAQRAAFLDLVDRVAARA